MAHIHDKIDFTTSAFVLHPAQDKLLFLFHLKLQKWLQPGGHVELDENPLQALTHELEEETGLKPDDYDILQAHEQPQASGNTLLPIPFHFNEHAFNESHKHIDMTYLVVSKTIVLTESPDGASAIEWFNQDAINDRHAKGEVFDGTIDIANWIFARLDIIRETYVKFTA